eukprot:2789954-Pleurochrysis_carterae.AAC.1
MQDRQRAALLRKLRPHFGLEEKDVLHLDVITATASTQTVDDDDADDGSDHGHDDADDGDGDIGGLCKHCARKQGQRKDLALKGRADVAGLPSRWGSVLTQGLGQQRPSSAAQAVISPSQHGDEEEIRGAGEKMAGRGGKAGAARRRGDGDHDNGSDVEHEETDTTVDGGAGGRIRHGDCDDADCGSGDDADCGDGVGGGSCACHSGFSCAGHGGDVDMTDASAIEHGVNRERQGRVKDSSSRDSSGAASPTRSREPRVAVMHGFPNPASTSCAPRGVHPVWFSVCDFSSPVSEFWPLSKVLPAVNTVLETKLFCDAISDGDGRPRPSLP